MEKPGEPLGDTVPSLPIDGPSRADPPPTQPAAPSSAPVLPGGTKVGRYIILARLGEGGMGVVYVARDPELDRKVALKLLRSESVEGQSGSEGRDRLVREAHAMAKLNHPNVVTIHDAGVYSGQVFLAVELVEGSNAWTWLQTPRSWRTVLEVLVKAGRGLAAAHAAGLVHRDFKPENILIGKNGDVKVGDFGLARAAASFRLRPSRLGGGAPGNTPSETLLRPLTQVGLVSGSPGYLAPELLEGRPADARSDEFSFSVALYEGLYGRRPFGEQLSRSIDSPIPPPPRETQVPAWVHRVLSRGLAFKPENRFPTLEALLDALSTDPSRRRRRVLTFAAVAAVVIAAVGGSALVLLRQQAADPCHDPTTKLAGVWDDAARTRLRAAFAATGASEAASVEAYAERAMDRTGNAWLAAYRDACEATRVRHTQSESALRLRLDCLDEQALDIRAAGEIIAHPDEKKLSATIGASRMLPFPLECADAHALSVIDQPSPANRPRIEALRERLARGMALSTTGRDDEAGAELKSLPDEARALGARSLEARSLLAFADTLAPEDKEVIPLRARAEQIAEAAHLDQLAVRAAALIAQGKATAGGPPFEVDAALDRARQGLRRVGDGGFTEYRVEQSVAYVESLRGHTAEAVAHATRALALATELFGGAAAETAEAAASLADELEPTGQYDQMVSLYSREISVWDALLGPTNRVTTVPQLNLAAVLLDLGRLGEAEQSLDRVSARIGGKEQTETAVELAVRAGLETRLGKTAESLATAQRALEMGRRLNILNDPDDTDLHRYAIEAYLRDGRPSTALAEYESSLAQQELAADSPRWVAFLRLGGWAYLDHGQPSKALPLLERALSLGAAHPFYPGWVARLRYQLAQALVLTRGDRKRAETLAREAHDELAGVDSQRDLLAEVDGWRAHVFSGH